MKRMLFTLLALAIAMAPSVSSAALVAALDFTDSGSAWTVIADDPGLPLVYELDGDPTNVGIAQDTTNSGQYRLSQEVFAPAGFTMSNIMVTFEASGFSSWVMDGRLGLHDEPEYALASDYSGRGGVSGDGVVVDAAKSLDASGDPDYTGVDSVFINVEIVKGLAGVWQANNVRNIQVFADLNPIPEPASFVLLGFSGLFALVRRR
ncbi:PEP-CTERM sorting domain-containing protein [Bythopirellula goksoeyrii]|uniref:Ice-binding protein C-terminal domain-containing protein n=1 Tax=Bythopirellula goksoeyrii TaxID=1400387 RepID=A0A5B9Q6T6_9BACT|nr:PEP-CTERM sorting domain-containing protein [Bythopirellula goksoeyrii]QEG33420.1 hypothetical protein Pr1d_06830 [Bythopirellula goksoeyrii]